jgi:hypothetical protein
LAILIVYSSISPHSYAVVKYASLEGVWPQTDKTLIRTSPAVAVEGINTDTEVELAGPANKTFSVVVNTPSPFQSIHAE